MTRASPTPVNYKDSLIFTIGGYCHGNGVQDVEVYDIALKKYKANERLLGYRKIPWLNRRKYGSSACVLNNFIYSFGGCLGYARYSNTIESLDVEAWKDGN